MRSQGLGFNLHHFEFVFFDLLFKVGELWAQLLFQARSLGGGLATS